MNLTCVKGEVQTHFIHNYYFEVTFTHGLVHIIVCFFNWALELYFPKLNSKYLIVCRL